MTYDLLTALALYCFASSITPGPNNIMLMTSGVNFGFLRTIPHILGVGIGFVVMLLCVGMGLAGIFQSWPPAQEILRWASALYLLWLAWKIATQPTGLIEAGRAATPMTFLQAAAFQWVNPKVWTMVVGLITLYTPDQSFGSIVSVAVVFASINIPCVSSWALLGQSMSRMLRAPAKLRVFNVVMAVLLVASMYPALFGV